MFNEYDIKLTAEQLKEIKGIYQRAATLPTEYFEAKPERVVGLDEIKMVVITENKSLQKVLDEQGIPYTVYDGSHEDRVSKVNEAPGTQFSLKDSAGNEITLTDRDIE